MSYVNCIHVCLHKAEGADEFSKLSYAQMGNDRLVQVASVPAHSAHDK